MSHEIRTPLNGIIGFTDLLSLSGLKEKQAEYADQITHAGRNLLRIVNDVLDFSKIEADGIDLENVPFDIMTTAERVASLIRTAQPNENVTISCTTLGDVCTRVVGDEMRVRQILTNIVGNASKFTREGFITIILRQEGSQVLVDVEDSGCGISADKLDTVFDEFTQADSSITRKFGGTGLGLSISRSLARLMSGDLTLTSELGVGTTVTLAIPRGLDAEQPEPALELENDPHTQAPHVFIVDDVQANRLLVEAALRSSGYRISGFESAEAMLSAMTTGEAPDLILMDVMLPGMDGRAAAQRIRNLESDVRRVPIIAMTGQVGHSEIMACHAAGMDGHIQKPIDVHGLTRLVSDMIKKRTREMVSERVLGERMHQLSEEYREYLQRLPNEFQAMVHGSTAQDLPGAVAQLAHAVAGTAGSLGFPAVTDAARTLEARAKAFVAGRGSKAELRDEIVQFLLCARRHAA